MTHKLWSLVKLEKILMIVETLLMWVWSYSRKLVDLWFRSSHQVFIRNMMCLENLKLNIWVNPFPSFSMKLSFEEDTLTLASKDASEWGQMRFRLSFFDQSYCFWEDLKFWGLLFRSWTFENKKKEVFNRQKLELYCPLKTWCWPFTGEG